MASCALCELKEIKEAIILEGNNCYVSVNPFPTLPGEIIIVPKEHYTIFEQVPIETLSELALLTKYFSAVLFETLSCQGTNIIVQNGSTSGQMIAHTSVRIIPRNNASELDTAWEPIQVSQEQLQDYAKNIIMALEKLNNTMKTIGVKTELTVDKSKEADKKVLVSETKEDKKEFFKKHWDDDDYMKRQLFRNP